MSATNRSFGRSDPAKIVLLIGGARTSWIETSSAVQASFVKVGFNHMSNGFKPSDYWLVNIHADECRLTGGANWTHVAAEAIRQNPGGRYLVYNAQPREKEVLASTGANMQFICGLHRLTDAVRIFNALFQG